MRYTSLVELRKHDPCASGWVKLLKYLNKTEAEDEALSFLTILNSNGIVDAIWCLRVLPDYDLDVMKFKLKCARRVEHLDKSGVASNCLDTLDHFIEGAVSQSELSAAAAAYAAAYAADAAAYAAAAYDAAAYAAADAADAAATAAAYAATAAAADAEREYQTEIFKEIFCNEES